MYRKHVGRALILALMLSGATSMNAQRITRQFKNVPLKTVLAEVEKELQYSIIYKKDEVNAVSYTHLDVYKRQAYAGMGRFPVARFAGLSGTGLSLCRNLGCFYGK